MYGLQNKPNEKSPEEQDLNSHDGIMSESRLSESSSAANSECQQLMLTADSKYVQKNASQTGKEEKHFTWPPLPALLLDLTHYQVLIS